MLVCGVDIGGTFTDLALFDADRRVVLTEKVLTTPEDPAQAVVIGLKRLTRRLPEEISQNRSQQTSHIIHATTLVTNALIERKGARVALITTAGFRDILDLRRENRYDIFNLLLLRPDPWFRSTFGGK